MKLPLIIAACLLSLSLAAGNDQGVNPDQYCAVMKDNRLVVLHQGNIITKDTMMSDGTQLLIDGTIIKKDGTRILLRAGQCMDTNGLVSGEGASETNSKTSNPNHSATGPKTNKRTNTNHK